MGTSQDREIVEQTSLEYTSTQSIFRFDVAGKIELIATFLSPVYADDLARQALQFSYLTVKARSVDGAPHEVQLYIDVTGGRYALFRLVVLVMNLMANGDDRMGQWQYLRDD
jgi:hypothetical protein